MAIVPYFEETYYQHNLRAGTLFNRAGTRMCYMPSEMLAGLQQVLEEEAGSAWRDIMSRVGRLWGRRVARRFQGELTEYYGRPLHEIPVKELTVLMEGFFAYHGWGAMTLDFSEAESGYICAKMSNSAFVEIIGASDAPVDHIVAGLLAEFFNQVSERTDIDCIETECSATGRSHCRMIIGIAPRLEKVRQLMATGLGHDEIMDRIVLSRSRKEVESDDTQKLAARRI